MKKPSRFLRVVATIGMLLGMLVVAAPVAAQAPTPPAINPSPTILAGGGIGGAQEVYFPWVGNDDNVGLDENANSTVTLQNLTGVAGYVYIWVGVGTGGGSGFQMATSALLAAGASKTFTAAELGVPSPGAPVVAALYATAKVIVPGSYQLCELTLLQDLNGDNMIGVPDGAGGWLDFCVTVSANTSVWQPLYLGGVVKSAAEGNSLPLTTSADTAVSGYNGLSGVEIGDYDAHYLPIVQYTCDGPGGCWDTRITVTNYRTDLNAAVTLRFFPASDGEGSLQTGFQLQALVNPGASVQFTLSEVAGITEGWIGSVHVLNDDHVGVIADRVKAGTSMWLTNTGSNQTAEWALQDNINFLLGGTMSYALFAPAVYLDYNGWNTGVSVANLVDADNTINIQYYVNAGNAPTTLTQRLAPHGMTFYYNPSDPPEDGTGQDEQMDRLAAMLVLSEWPVAAAVDAVKYTPGDRNTGQAMTYNASGNIHGMQAMPLVQKGSPATGLGATSGLHLFNPLPLQNVINVLWLNQSGWNGSNFGTTTVVVPAEALGFAYTMNHHNIPNGYWGSAVAYSTIFSGFLPLPFGMTSANVDYNVSGDGSVIWNGYNPCGLFRQSNFTNAGDPFGTCSFFPPVITTTPAPSPLPLPPVLPTP